FHRQGLSGQRGPGHPALRVAQGTAVAVSDLWREGDPPDSQRRRLRPARLGRGEPPGGAGPRSVGPGRDRPERHDQRLRPGRRPAIMRSMISSVSPTDGRVLAEYEETPAAEVDHHIATAAALQEEW